MAYLKGGFGSAVIEFMTDNGYRAAVKRLGIPDYFVQHGTQDELIGMNAGLMQRDRRAVREMHGRVR